MTAPPPKQPPREPTPEERARAARLVWLIVLGLPTVVGAMVAYLTWGGRQVRDYGREVIGAVQQQSGSSIPGLEQGGEECGKVVPGIPAGVQSCRIERVNDGLLVTLTVDGGRQYQVSSAGGKVSDRVQAGEVDARAYAGRVATHFPAFVQANKPPALELQAVPCRQVIPDPVPAGVQACQVESGPADGPQVALKLTDGRTVTLPF
ncbi:hypothetical protein [Deinococcus fonticola]|uniref:hypothetical protein n=1 Tax=Deinococcus fonticola TaxID=2528713 RepID=UPI00107519FB|nr:hypothetical protein [Deinococcus fonticola]